MLIATSVRKNLFKSSLPSFIVAIVFAESAFYDLAGNTAVSKTLGLG